MRDVGRTREKKASDLQTFRFFFESELFELFQNRCLQFLAVFSEFTSKNVRTISVIFLNNNDDE